MSKPTFERIHEIGARDFGAGWLPVNRHVINCCMAYEIDYQKHKAGLSFIALRILQYTQPKKVEGER